MKTASIAEVKVRLNAYLRSAAKEPVVITRNGKRVGVLLATEDDEEIYRLLLSRSPRFRAIIEASQRQIDEGKGIPHEEFWRRIEEKNAKRIAQEKSKQRNGRARRRS